MSRTRPDGVRLDWHLVAIDAAFGEGLPFFIQWHIDDADHPGRAPVEHRVPPSASTGSSSAEIRSDWRHGSVRTTCRCGSSTVRRVRAGSLSPSPAAHRSSSAGHRFWAAVVSDSGTIRAQIPVARFAPRSPGHVTTPARRSSPWHGHCIERSSSVAASPGSTAAATLARDGHPVTVVEGAEHLGGRARAATATGSTSTSGPTPSTGRSAGSTCCAASASPSGGAAPDRPRRRARRRRGRAGGAAPPPRRRRRRRVLKAMTGLGVARRRPSGPGGRPRSGSTRVTDDRPGGRAIASVVRTATYSADIALLDAGAATAQLRPRPHGVLYLHHGWSSLVDGLADVVRAGGGEIMTGTPRRRPSSTTSACTPCASPTAARSPPRPSSSPSTTRGAPPGCWSGDAAGAGSPRRPTSGARAHGPPRRRPAPAPVDRGSPTVLGIDEPIFLTVPSSVADVRARRRRRHPGRPVPAARRGARRPPRRALEAVLDVHQPDWRDHVVDARYVPAVARQRRPRPGRDRRHGRAPGVDVAGVARPGDRRRLGRARAGCSPTRRSCPASAAATAVHRDMLEGVTRSPSARDRRRRRRSRPPGRGCSASPTGCSAAGSRPRTSSATSPSAGRRPTGRRSASPRAGW